MDSKVLLFDVNETLLDVKALGARFTTIFGDTKLLPEWFGMLLRYSLEVTVTGDYRSFDELAVGALVTTARRADTPVSDADATALVDSMAELPAHPDVADGLAALNDAGFRLATLTNSRLDVGRAQLANAGLDSYFDMVLSVETIRRFKPHPETYHYAAAQLGVDITNITMVAAHDWDVNGALLAGANAAFVERQGAGRAPHDRIPEIAAPNLTELAPLLIEATT